MHTNTFDPENGQIRRTSDKCAPLIATVVDPWEHVEPSYKTLWELDDFIILGRAMAAAPQLHDELIDGIDAVDAMLAAWSNGYLAASVNALEAWAGRARTVIEMCKES